MFLLADSYPTQKGRSIRDRVGFAFKPHAPKSINDGPPSIDVDPILYDLVAMTWHGNQSRDEMLAGVRSGDFHGAIDLCGVVVTVTHNAGLWGHTSESASARDGKNLVMKNIQATRNGNMRINVSPRRLA